MECTECIFTKLNGCPVNYSKNNAGCLYLAKDYKTCKTKDCGTCKHRNNCKKYGYKPE